MSSTTILTIEQTLSIIKPDGVRKKIIGEIQKRFDDAGLNILKAKMLEFTIDDAKSFIINSFMDNKKQDKDNYIYLKGKDFYPYLQSVKNYEPELLL